MGNGVEAFMIPVAETSLERRVVSKVSWRLLPFLLLLYLVASIDRINVAVARLQMPRDVALSADDYGFGAGLFFAGYFLFQLPSNLILGRFGIRRWIGRLMILWGMVSAAMVFVQGVRSFCVLRFLLGAAEAGFFPGILYYLTGWFRAQDRARAVALFMTAGALAGVVGNPISGALLTLDGAGGLKGWQWLFLVEGMPAILLGCVVLRWMTERPSQAAWLEPEERAWLDNELAQERVQREPQDQPTLRAALTNPWVWFLCALHFMFSTCGNGLELWLPEIVRGMTGLGHFSVSLLSALPYVVAVIGMVLIAAHSDRTEERKFHVAIPALVAALGFAAAAHLGQHALALAALCVARLGMSGALAPAWTYPPRLLSGTAAAAGIAIINSVGNLGGVLGPWLLGHLSSATAGFTWGLSGLSALMFLSGILALLLPGRNERSGKASSAT
jgi:ACS family tartrate transporter-like MFS transporter